MQHRETAEVGSMTLNLLDSAQGHPLQTWRFRNRASVSIGRGSENDINLADVKVSRKHVELVYRDAKWWLVSHGRNGTWMNGALLSDASLKDRSIFQLGANGPSFQFFTMSETVSTVATLDGIDPAELDFLEIDQARKTEEVQQIVEAEAFKELQQQARRLKAGGDPEETRL